MSSSISSCHPVDKQMAFSQILNAAANSYPDNYTGQMKEKILTIFNQSQTSLDFETRMIALQIRGGLISIKGKGALVVLQIVQMAKSLLPTKTAQETLRIGTRDLLRIFTNKLNIHIQKNFPSELDNARDALKPFEDFITKGTLTETIIETTWDLNVENYISIFFLDAVEDRDFIQKLNDQYPYGLAEMKHKVSVDFSSPEGVRFANNNIHVWLKESLKETNSHEVAMILRECLLFLFNRF